MKNIKFLLLFIFCSISIIGTSQSKFTIENGELVLPKPILFEKSTAIIKAESKATLDFIKDYLIDKPSVTMIRIEGNSYFEKNGSLNQQLSEKRALAVANYLVKAGIDCMRIIPVGFGSNKPISEINENNERIVIKNAMLNNRPIGGMPIDGGGMMAGDPCK
ncbi:MAG: OmpA family protein [Bacteroidetes bacterium]|nr:OmpA family protein [Bacteroidota bacterium]